MKTIKIGKRFYDDHCERDLIAPTIIRQTKTHYLVDGTDNEALRELLSDADYYKESAWFDPEYFGLCRSAAATHAAIINHLKNIKAKEIVDTPKLYVKKADRGYIQ
tara:strand:+ start:165 stop:482 length:318 start_codon:yes stop_codon:yes gene_type:complete